MRSLKNTSPNNFSITFFCCCCSSRKFYFTIVNVLYSLEDKEDIATEWRVGVGFHRWTTLSQLCVLFILNIKSRLRSIIFVLIKLLLNHTFFNTFNRQTCLVVSGKIQFYTIFVYVVYEKRFFSPRSYLIATYFKIINTVQG